MGKRSINQHHHHHHIWAKKSQTLPPSPSHSSSSSDFEFTISMSPRNKSSSALCPADELFYKGQLLPLHPSPRLSMVRTLLLASSSTSSSSDGAGTSTTASRDSTGSSNDSRSELVLLAESEDSSRRASSVDEEPPNSARGYFSLARLFKKEPNNRQPHHPAPQPDSSVGRISAVAKEVIRKYLKKVKPLYEKISQKQQHQQQQKMMLGRLTTVPASSSTTTNRAEGSVKGPNKKEVNGGRSGGFSHSFSGNLRYPRRKSSISSCPSSIRSSPSHSSVLCRPKGIMYNNNNLEQTTSSSMDELQSAIQGAIAHCKNSLLPHNNNKSTIYGGSLSIRT